MAKATFRRGHLFGLMVSEGKSIMGREGGVVVSGSHHNRKLRAHILNHKPEAERAN